MRPDLVSRVMCQRRAYCTSADPRRERAWLERNIAVFFFQASRELGPAGGGV